MLFTLLLLGLSPSSADRCASVPPSLWCGSDELSKECGSEKLCTRYRSAAYNKAINLTLLVEALCPFCQGWMVDEFYPNVFKNFAEFINVEFVPFGNAEIINGTITCQHGPEECMINRFESCLIHVLQSQDHYLGVPFENASALCFRDLSIGEADQNLIQSCMVSELGEKLQQEAAEKTANVWPDQHIFVPWIIVNGVSLISKQAMIDNLPYLLCDWYTGDEEIPFCSSEEAKRRSNSALRRNRLIN
ncbi:unnamed protein product [Angiostrongylus costaricensis]|uniref:Saposin A-type domain-containing protein n=1 Tax=Angiostrongylus costaricensis TaxID=334426 RepID=A0A0R3PRI5_ANGCS|nr:unnamed protein product [Angiostrongylus costaricensis]